MARSRTWSAASATGRPLALVEGGYHALLDDYAAEETLRIVLRWLEERTAGQAR